MKEEQIGKLNKVALIILTIIEVSLFLLLVAGGLSNGISAGILTQTISILASFVVTITYYLKHKNKITFAHVSLISIIITLLIIMIFNRFAFVSIYSFPIMIVSLLYLDAKFTSRVSFSIVGTNIIHCLKFIITKNLSPDINSELFVFTCMVIITAYASIQISKLLSAFQKENMEAIINSADEQSKTAMKITKVAEDIIRDFDKSQEMTQDLKSIVDVNHTSMSNISESIVDTAETIEKQSNMTFEIKTNIENAEIESIRMSDIANSTNSFIKESSLTFDKLKSQAVIVKDANNSSLESINNLSKKITEVEAITKSISEISENTNLLALNASIEAARAGDAGRGFAVVAEEIRQLSERTNKAANQISNIISELVGDIKKVNTNVNNSTASTEKQNEIINTVDGELEKVNSAINNLDDAIINVKNMIHEINKANGSILDHISNLSATSEEVAASSQEGLKVSERSVSLLNDFNKIMTEIYSLANTLKS